MKIYVIENLRFSGFCMGNFKWRDTFVTRLYNGGQKVSDPPLAPPHQL